MRKFVLLAAGLCCTSLALAQSAADAALKDRMERAKRDASNPMRIIIEASQVKRTRAGEPGVASPVPAAAAPVAARPPAEARPVAERRPARPAAEPAPAPATEPAARTLASTTAPPASANSAAQAG